ncbi:MAG: chromosome segregation protein SMC [Candidatus Cloacimonadota bacterium]|nr:chromosome segregation protein SMC [Candidatus Cloacimonadota bacterium]
MKLSKLEIDGFKSFAEPTKFRFAAGLTGVVGPNGCGKSNISDAIHWVLGEQNVRKLRGASMSDVIFKGTRKRTTHSYCKVSITIDNDKKIIPIDTEEVAIARKVTQDGSSEYFLNGNSCRLKDILNLFYDTGMGQRAYSFMELKMIDELLNAKDNDKRYLFEEAAGIMKYNQSKNNCRNKLNNVENDLIRLEDIIAEVKHQTYSLRHQVGRAKKYKKIRKKINTIKIQLQGIKYFELQDKLTPLKNEHINSEKMTAENTNKISKIYKIYNSKNKQLLEIEAKLQIRQKNIRAIENSINELEKTILLNQQQIKNIKENLRNNKNRIAQLESTNFSSQEMLKNDNENLKLAEEKLKQNGSELIDLKTDVDKINKEIDEHYSQLEKLNIKINEYEHQKQMLNNTKAEIETRKKLFEAERTSLEKKRTDYQNKFDKFTSLVVEAEKSSKIHNSNKSTFLDKRAKIENKQDELKTKIENIEREIHSSEMKTRTLQNEKQQIEKWEKNLSGHQKGTKKIFEYFKNDKGFDSLANNIEVSDEFISLIENSLRTMITSVICSSAKTDDVLNLLEKNSLNSSLILYNSDIDKMEITEQKIFEDATPLSSIVKLNHGGINPNIIRNIYLVKDRKTARELIANNSSSETEYKFITPKGEIFSTHGWIQTNWYEDTKTGLLSRKKAIKEFNKQIQTEKKNLEKLLSIKDKFAIQITEQNAALISINKKITEIEHAAENHRKNILNLQMQKDNFGELKTEADSKLSKIGNDFSEINLQLEKIELEIKNLPEHDSKSLKQEQDRFQKELSLSRNRRFKINKKLQDKNIAIARLEKDVHFCKENISKSNQTFKNNSQVLDKLKDSIEPQKSKIKDLGNETETLELTLNKKIEKLNAEKKSIVDIENRFHSLKTATEDLKIQQHELEFKKDILSKNKSEAELKIQETKLKIEHIREEVFSHLHHDLTHDESDDYKELNLGTLQTDLGKFQIKIEKMGPINLAAIEDYEKQKERFDFLQNQQKDLLESKENLKEAITQLNDTAEKMFLTTFQKIKENFEKLHLELFSGGKGILRLEDPSDPLNSKIEILSTPKGKKFTHINLLSSGEKALTAIALLFSIYLVKPSPFCILDEIDAPLDDSNIDRFLQLLDKFSQKTQFIIITHNKRTIEAANYLYGITMEEEGVSKIVSVDLG